MQNNHRPDVGAQFRAVVRFNRRRFAVGFSVSQDGLRRISQAAHALVRLLLQLWPLLVLLLHS